MWLKPISGTVLSYSTNSVSNLLTISMSKAGHLILKLDSTRLPIKREHISSDAWSHIVWTWAGYDNHNVSINGKFLDMRGYRKDTRRSEIPGNGRLVLGQEETSNGARTDEEQWVRKKAFIGHVSFLNIWKKVLNSEEIIQIKKDCKLNWCGDGIEWADLRSGTRGPLRMRWPSDVPFTSGVCYTGKDQADSCEKYCTKTKGAQCNAEVAKNIIWPRSKANITLTMPCPGLIYPFNYTNTSIPELADATRTCGLQGTWIPPDVSSCISGEVSAFLQNTSNPNKLGNREDRKSVV